MKKANVITTIKIPSRITERIRDIQKYKESYYITIEKLLDKNNNKKI